MFCEHFRMVTGEHPIDGSSRRFAPHRRRGLVLLAVGVLLLTVLWRLAMPPVDASVAIDESRLAAINPPLTAAESLVDPALPAVETPPEPSLLGVWEDEFYGKRRMTFHDDGTATMTLELDPVGQLLYGPRLLFHIAWEQTGDKLTLRMTGGEPAGSTATLSKLFGESSEQTIESLTADQMRLRSGDSGKLYVHRRVVEQEETAGSRE
jgi:hypothetical protein